MPLSKSTYLSRRLSSGYSVKKSASGKSTDVFVISTLTGMQILSQASGKFVTTSLTNSTFPLCWDGPTNNSIIRQPLSGIFHGLGNQRHGRGDERPLTSFILTVDFKMKLDKRLFENTLPICFKKKHKQS